jgi:hypothetical protein
MPRKVKPTQTTAPEIRATVRELVDKYFEELPFIRLAIREEVDQAIRELRPSQSELYARKLRS